MVKHVFNIGFKLVFNITENIETKICGTISATYGIVEEKNIENQWAA